MANYIATDTDLTTVANAIRTKGGTAAQLTFPSGFASAIANLPEGGISGGYNVTFNDGTDDVAIVSVKSGESINANPIILSNPPYIFNGWSTTSGGTSAITFPYTPNNNITLYPIWLSLPNPKTNLNSYTWAEIKQLADALVAGTIDATTLSSTYNVVIGDTKSSSINNETHDYRLIGINHDVDANGNTLGMTFDQVDTMTQFYAMKSTVSSTDSWENSDLKTTLEGFVVASDLAAVITPAKKVCAKNVSSGTPTYNYINNVNGLWIESETEVFGTQKYTVGSTVEGSKYAYFTNNTSRIKQHTGYNYSWWLRSPYRMDATVSRFATVLSTGVGEFSSPRDGTGVAPCFCI